MKKFALLFMVAVLVMFGMITKAHAEEKNIEIKFYEHENVDDLSELEKSAFNYLLFYVHDSSIDIQESGDHETSDYVADYYHNEKKFATVTDNGTELTSQLLLDSFTRDDDIEYTFNEDDKYFFQNNGTWDALKNYDGIKVQFSNKVGSVFIKEIELIEQTGMAVINSPAKIDGLNIDVDVKFKDVNDKVVYKAIVKNNTDTDYFLTSGNIDSKDEYIKYTFDYDGGNDVLKAGEKRIVTITMTYDKEVPAELLASGVYESNQRLGITLSTEREEKEANPKTVDGIIKTVAVLAISVVLLVVMVKVRIVRKAMMVVLAFVMVMPAIAKAIEKLNITINASVAVTKNPSLVLYSNDLKEPTTYYEFEEGMTWEEWIDSEYNVNHYDNIDEISFETNEYDACRAENPLPEFGLRTAYVDPCEDYYGRVDLGDEIRPFNQIKYYRITR